MPGRDLTIWTVGHSTRPIGEFIDLLRAQQIALLADVRSHPGSRKFPHFNQAPLAAAVEAESISYAHFSELGGRRKARPDSPNAAWRNASFRVNADYMQTRPYESAKASSRPACSSYGAYGRPPPARDGRRTT